MIIRNLFATLLLFVISLTASALRSTDIEAYLNPAYRDYQPHRILLVTSGSADFRKEIYKKASKRIGKKYGVEILQFNEIFIPTRQWSDTQISETLDELSVDSVLEITTEGYESEFQRLQMGSTTSTAGSANISGNNIYGSSTSRTTNNFASFAFDSAQISAKLTERSSGNTVWIAGISTKGSGTMMVGAGWTASSVISNLVKHWKSSGLLQKKR